MTGKSGDSVFQRWTPAALGELLDLRANRKSHGKGAATSSADGEHAGVTCNENTGECMSTGERQSICVILHSDRVKTITAFLVIFFILNTNINNNKNPETKSRYNSLHSTHMQTYV